MPGRRPERPRPIVVAQTPEVEDPATQRAIEVLTGAVQDVQSKRTREVIEDIDLIVGTNRVQHGLGRRCAGYTLVATVADATFSHSIDKTNPRPELEVWIEVIGVAQPGATVEVF